MSAEAIVFWIMAPISIAAAVGMLLARNAVHAALFLIVNFFTISVFFLLLGSPFLFVVQITVYAGAIMVLFLFVIMLLGVDRRESMVEQLKGQRVIAIALAVGVALEIILAIRLAGALTAEPAADFAAANAGGNVQALSKVLFKDYLLPFEVTSVLLIVAAIGAMVLTRTREGGMRAAEMPPAEPAAAAEEVTSA